MRIWLKNVSRAWADVVEKVASPEQVVLWQADARRAWRSPAPGDYVVFRPEDRERVIIGYGRYVETTYSFAEDAWMLFQFGMGAWTLDSLLAQIAARRRTPSETPVIANAIIVAPVFFPPLNPFDLPAAFPINETAVPLCSASGRRGRILLASLRHHAGRSLVFGETTPARLLGRLTYRVPGTSVRLGRSVLRTILAKHSGHRCAISGERVPVTQDAAHAWPLQYGGRDYLGNVFLLETQLNRLWDDGLIGVDEHHRIMVSAQMRLFEPNPSYLKFAGQPLRRRLFGSPYPDEANLRWHRNTLFRWPKYQP